MTEDTVPAAVPVVVNEKSEASTVTGFASLLKVAVKSTVLPEAEEPFTAAVEEREMPGMITKVTFSEFGKTQV